MDPPDISITEGGGKRRKPLSLPPKSVESYRSTTGSNEAVVDGTGTVDGFPALSNRGDVNDNGTTDDMDWVAMGKEEVQDQHNDANELEICPIYILSCNSKYSNGKLMLRITGLYGIGEEKVEADDVKIEFPDTLAL